MRCEHVSFGRTNWTFNMCQKLHRIPRNFDNSYWSSRFRTPLKFEFYGVARLVTYVR